MRQLEDEARQHGEEKTTAIDKLTRERGQNHLHTHIGLKFPSVFDINQIIRM